LAPEEPVVTWLEALNPTQRKVINEMITGSSLQEIAERLVDKILAEGAL
jgi:hypothetical protein